MITWSDLGDSFWLAGFLLLISVVIFSLAYGIAQLIPRSMDLAPRDGTLLRTGFLGGLPLGFTGMVAGFLTGSSRSPAVSALVPAILTFIGLIVVYMLGKGRLRTIIVAFAVFVFSGDIVVGTVLGSASRDRHEDLLGSIEVQRAKADQEFAIRRYRGALGLPLDVPKASPPVTEPEKP